MQKELNDEDKAINDELIDSNEPEKDKKMKIKLKLSLIVNIISFLVVIVLAIILIKLKKSSKLQEEENKKLMNNLNELNIKNQKLKDEINIQSDSDVNPFENFYLKPNVFIKNFILNNSNYTLYICTNINNKILFTIEQEDNLSPEYYFKNISLSELKNLGKTFLDADTGDEVINIIKIINSEETINNKNYSISLTYNINSEMKITFKNHLKSEVNEELSITLNEKRKKIYDINQYFLNYIKIIKEIEGFISLSHLGFAKSEIVKSEEKINFIYDYIKSVEKRNVFFKQILKGSKDGDKKDNFHELCDNISPILLIVKTDEDVIFGGYTSITVNTKERSYDDKAFVFNVNKRKIYKIKNGEYAIDNGKYPDTLINFCGKDGDVINVGERFLQYGWPTCTKENSSYEGMTIDYEINSGDRFYLFEELEIYQVYFE